MEILPLQQKSRIRLICVLVMSTAVTTYGLFDALSFNDTAGPATLAPAHWPHDTNIQRFASRPTLLVFAHPFCSCTRATFDELTKVLSRRRPHAPAPEIVILFFRPGGASWKASAIWQRAIEISGAHVSWDEAGAEAKRFGAGTSGATLLYASDGRLLFEGGVTGARGHEGDNLGADKLAAALNLHPAPRGAHSQVFGCPLSAPGSLVTQEAAR